MRIRTGLIALALGAAACNGTNDTTSTSDAPAPTPPSATSSAPSGTADASVSGSTTEAPSPMTTTGAETTTTAPVLDVVASGAGVTVATSAECAGLTAPADDGSVTWSDGEKLWEASRDLEPTCLFHLSGPVSAIEWSPRGDAVLINGRLVVGGSQSGTLLPAAVAWQFDRAPGESFLGVDASGEIVDWDGSGPEPIGPLFRHDTFAQHPSGLRMAVFGAADAGTGIFIAAADGSAASRLVPAPGVTVRDIGFSADASRMYFIAEHENERHLHSIEIVPTGEDGESRTLNVTPEENAVTHSTAGGSGRIEFSAVVTHPADPLVALWTTDECVPDGRRGFQVFTGAPSSAIQALGPAAALGFVGKDPATITVAAISGPCNGLRDLGLMSANVETGAVEATPLAGNVVAAAVRAIAPTPDHDWQDVTVVDPPT